MRRSSILMWIGILGVAVGWVLLAAAQPSEANVMTLAAVAQSGESGCLECHAGIEPIRDESSGMMADIFAKGEEAGDPAGCVVCHGGNPDETEDAELAHTGAPEAAAPHAFFPDPGSVWVAAETCGQCHPDYDYALERSLMNTEAGKIQGNMFTWTIQKDQTVVWGNYDVDDPDGFEPIFGTDAYKAYMLDMTAEHPAQYPESLEQLPNPTLEEVRENPFLAGFTYQRQQCQRCHVSVRGRDRRGDYRGMGCSSCHIPYSNEGLYEGGDESIPKDEVDHQLTHQIQGTREALNGIPTESCVTCHNRGKRIGVTFQGLMEFPYGTPFTEEGTSQPKLHTKTYLYIQDDLHHQVESWGNNPEGGMLCQDCHTSMDMHGDGNIFGTTLAQVEIECADCHGTTDEYPWDLPIGYQEEFGTELEGEPRGVTAQLLEFQTMATVYPAQDGYLLTTRGNPFGNVVRQGEQRVILHSATGRDYQVPLLKAIRLAEDWKSEASEVAMDSVSQHMDELECYSCHSDWAPQCYGCHVKASYAEGAASTDYVAIGNSKFPDGQTIAEHPEAVDDSTTSPGAISGSSPGEINESRSYLRWEEPILGINGEGRVSPLMPGCQVVKTVFGPDGEVLLHNAIGTAPASEGGALSIDMAPVQPHSATRVARTCESCHSDPKALGYGIQDGRYQQRYPEDMIVDLEFPDGSIWPTESQVQIAAIPEMNIDWSQIVSRDGEQLQIVGSHWEDSRPLDQDQRERMERTGVCMGCHQNMARADFWTDEVVGKFGVVVSDDEHIDTMNEVLIEATTRSPIRAGLLWGLLAAALALGVGVVVGLFLKPLRKEPSVD